jgi:hypothetical protein
MTNLTLVPQPTSITAVSTSGLAALQSAYALFRSGGSFYVIDRHQLADVQAGKRTEIEFFKKQEAEVLLKRFLENQAIACDAKLVIHQFWTNPNTKVFDRITFSPLPQPATTINYWVGPTAKPHLGNCDIIKAFLLNIICSGSSVVFTYLFCFLAHMLQRPEEKPGIIIVLLGGQGTGKGTFFRILRAIWDRTTIQVSDIEEVIGRFNAALERNYIVCMDEAMFSGDKKAVDRLKSLVTETTCRIEQKYQPARTIDSYHRFFAASNHSQFAHIEQDDRRFAFLRVSDDAKGNHQFFGQISKAIEDPVVIDALFYELVNLDISQFNVRKKPQTSELIRQKLRSLDGFSRFWYEVLTAGSLTGHSEAVSPWICTIFIPTGTLVRNYTSFNKRADWYRTVQQDDLIQEFKRLCPSAIQTRQQEKYHGQRRGWSLPDLVTARHEFEIHIGGPVNWQDDISPDPGFDATTLDQYWAGRDPARKSVEEIFTNWNNDDD